MQDNLVDHGRRGLLFAATAATAGAAAAAVTTSEEAMAQAGGSPQSDRYERGMAVLKQVGGAGYDSATRALDPLSPDLSRILIESAYGDAMARPGLSLKVRELVNVAILTVLGNAPSPLKYHAAGMLNTGWSPRELVETVLHSLIYAGFPAALAGIGAVRATFKERGIDYQASSARPDGDHWQLGIENLRLIGGDSAADQVRLLAELAPDLARLTIEFAHGEIWNRPGLALKDRQLATLAMVIARGNQIDAVRNHLEGCLRLGWTRAELTEVLIQMPSYIGWPVTLTATGPALEVFERVEREGLSNATGRTAALAQERRAEDDEARFGRGQAALGRISQASGEAVVRSFDDIAPDLGRYIVAFSYGDVFGRDDLDLKTRELASVAALTATGRGVDAGPLKVHVNAALNVGAHRQEVVETILHMLPYVGFTAVQQAMNHALDVFSDRGIGSPRLR